MAEIEIETIDHWLNLTLRIDECFTHYNDYIFRGQADADWPLESSLSRAIRRVYPEDKSKLQEWKEILFQFRTNLRGRCTFDLSTAHDDELWTIGQHHGLHTPMLDWTRSPYVALFFAFLGPSKSGKRALWAILEQDVSSLYDEDKSVPEDERVTVVEPMTHHNPRLVSQRGLFLKIPPSQSLDNLINKLKTDDHVTMFKFIFDDHFRDDALAALDLRNINYASLFPDIAGSALHSNFQFEIAKHLESMREEGWPET